MLGSCPDLLSVRLRGQIPEQEALSKGLLMRVVEGRGYGGSGKSGEPVQQVSRSAGKSGRRGGLAETTVSECPAGPA